jgi:biotin carboxyl carrier protein
MRNALPIHLLKWPITLAVLTGLLFLAYFVHAQIRKEREEEQASDKVQKPERLDKPGEVTLKAASARNYEVAPARPLPSWSEPLTVYGRVVPNPKATYEVRSAFPGTVVKGRNGWLALGHQVKAGATLGWVKVRIDPQVRLDLQSKLQEAEKQLAGATEARKILDARVKRFQGSPKSIPPRELEEALIQRADAKTKEAVAEVAVQLWGDALAEANRTGQANGSPWVKPLRAPADGEVTELVAQPDTAVDAAGVVARLTDFRRLLVRLDFPPEALAKEPPRTVELTTGQTPPTALRGARNQPLADSAERKVRATLVSLAPQVDPASQFAGYFYEVDAVAAKVNWRPGLFVQAELKGVERTDAPRQDAVAVPGEALLYHQGRAFVYKRLRQDARTVTFKRCEVQVLGRDGDRWVLAETQDILEGVPVVSGGAQGLLSEEFNADTDD